MTHTLFSFTRRMRRPIARLTAVLASLCLIISGSLSPSMAAPSATDTAPALRENLNAFEMPASLGRFTQARCLDSGLVVVNIQDLHCHAGVQKNISGLLALLTARLPVTRIFVEGGIGAVDTSWSRRIASAPLRDDVIRTLLACGRLSGAEHYAVTAARPVALEGLEEPRLFHENLGRLGQIILERAAVADSLRGIRARLDELKSAHFGWRNGRLDDLTLRYECGVLSPAGYYRRLLHEARALGADADGFWALAEMVRADDYLRFLNSRRISGDINRLISDLRRRMPYGAFRLMMDPAVDPARRSDLYFALMKAAGAQGIDLARHYGALDEFFAHVRKSQELNPEELIRQERALLSELRLRAAATDAERDVCFLVAFGGVLENYLNGRLTADEYRYYRAHQAAFRETWARYAGAGALAGLGGYFPLRDAYYQANQAREQVFLRCLSGRGRAIPAAADARESRPGYSDPAAILSSAREVVIVITGGFHSEGLSRLLAGEALSSVVVTPQVAGGTRDAQRLYDRLAGVRLPGAERSALALALFGQTLGEDPALQVGGQLTVFVQSKLELALRGIPAWHDAVRQDAARTIALGIEAELLAAGARFVYTGQGPQGEACFMFSMNGVSVPVSYSPVGGAVVDAAAARPVVSRWTAASQTAVFPVLGVLALWMARIAAGIIPGAAAADPLVVAAALTWAVCGLALAHIMIDIHDSAARQAVREALLEGARLGGSRLAPDDPARPYEFTVYRRDDGYVLEVGRPPSADLSPGPGRPLAEIPLDQRAYEKLRRPDFGAILRAAPRAVDYGMAERLRRFAVLSIAGVLFFAPFALVPEPVVGADIPFAVVSLVAAAFISWVLRWHVYDRTVIMSRSAAAALIRTELPVPRGLELLAGFPLWRSGASLSRPRGGDAGPAEPGRTTRRRGFSSVPLWGRLITNRPDPGSTGVTRPAPRLAHQIVLDSSQAAAYWATDGGYGLVRESGCDTVIFDLTGSGVLAEKPGSLAGVVRRAQEKELNVVVRLAAGDDPAAVLARWMGAYPRLEGVLIDVGDRKIDAAIAAAWAARMRQIADAINPEAQVGLVFAENPSADADNGIQAALAASHIVPVVQRAADAGRPVSAGGWVLITARPGEDFDVYQAIAAGRSWLGQGSGVHAALVAMPFEAFRDAADRSGLPPIQRAGMIADAAAMSAVPVTKK